MCDMSYRTWHMEVELLIGANPSVRTAGVLHRSLVGSVFGPLPLLELLDHARRDRAALGIHVNLVELGRVEAEDFRLVLFDQFLVAEILGHLVCELESSDRIDCS